MNIATIPFWEQRRGGGPCTKIERWRAELDARAEDRRRRLANPLAYFDGDDGGDYRERVERVRSCIDCGAKSPGAHRCIACVRLRAARRAAPKKGGGE